MCDSVLRRAVLRASRKAATSSALSSKVLRSVFALWRVLDIAVTLWVAEEK